MMFHRAKLPEYFEEAGEVFDTNKWNPLAFSKFWKSLDLVLINPHCQPSVGPKIDGYRPPPNSWIII